VSPNIGMDRAAASFQGASLVEPCPGTRGTLGLLRTVTDSFRLVPAKKPIRPEKGAKDYLLHGVVLLPPGSRDARGSWVKEASHQLRSLQL
jgi:hypothetical protein